jgi:hypothetical protein
VQHATGQLLADATNQRYVSTILMTLPTKEEDGATSVRRALASLQRQV